MRGSQPHDRLLLSDERLKSEGIPPLMGLKMIRKYRHSTVDVPLDAKKSKAHAIQRGKILPVAPENAEAASKGDEISEVVSPRLPQHSKTISSIRFSSFTMFPAA